MAFPYPAAVNQKYTDPNGTSWIAVDTNVWKIDTESGGSGVWTIKDNTLAAPSNTLGQDNDIATVSNNAGTRYVTYTKRAGVWTSSEYQQATTTLSGISELATNAEVQAGADTSRIVTPSGLSSRTATTSRTGIAETATQAETDAGTDTGRIVTPSVLRNLTANSLTAQGIANSIGIGNGKKVYSIAHANDLNQPTGADVPNPVNGDSALVHNDTADTAALWTRQAGVWINTSLGGGGGITGIQNVDVVVGTNLDATFAVTGSGIFFGRLFQTDSFGNANGYLDGTISTITVPGGANNSTVKVATGNVSNGYSPSINDSTISGASPVSNNIWSATFAWIGAGNITVTHGTANTGVGVQGIVVYF